jgi:hypothetical protein
MAIEKRRHTMTGCLNGPLQILGLGCGGSFFARQIAWKGSEFAPEVHGWDGDVVEDHNVGPQTYQKEHVGMFKTEALALQLLAWGRIPLIQHPEYIDGPRDLSGYVLMAVDKMSTRWKLWEGSIRRNKNVSLMIELRLETIGSYIHVVDPNNDDHVSEWERYWYPDNEATTLGLSCSGATTLFPIADLTAALCLTQLIKVAHADQPDNQIRVELDPLNISTYRW